MSVKDERRVRKGTKEGRGGANKKKSDRWDREEMERRRERE